MEFSYSIEKSVQIIIALLKVHHIKKVIASPGSTNVCLVASLQSDPYFEMYSSVDERSAAYLACGLSCESGEPVVLTCTEATASRNYFSGLTEAYYRKLPILAITATNKRTLIGQNHPQMIDRTHVSHDVARKNLFIPFISRDKDIAGYVNLINDTILELTRNGGGPVHIEYETEYSQEYTVKELPRVQVVKRYNLEDEFPSIPKGKIAIISGAHKKWSRKLVNIVELFCEKYNAVFLADHISNYHGKYAINPTIITSQVQYTAACCEIDTVIYIGDISSAYRKNYKIKNVWRVNPDGEIRNVMGNQSAVFEMSEISFFEHFCKMDENRGTTYYEEWKAEQEKLYYKVPELPFSNLWCAQHTENLLPDSAVLFLGIENTLRCWNFFETPNTVNCFCNTGGYGIDGGISSLIGASLANPNKLYFGITGDLAFFYDMNVLGNRHVGKNIRLMVINNAIGQQFRNPGNPAADSLGKEVNAYIAAAGHYGNKSPDLLKHYAEDLGYLYLSASTKEEYLEVVKRFVSLESGDKSIVFEVFTDSQNETEALRILLNLEISASSAAKGAIKKVLGDKGVRTVRGILGK